MRTAALFLILAIAASEPVPVGAQIVPQRTGSEAEFRAMHAPGPATLWAAGRGGRFAMTRDAGVTWVADSVPGAAELFFTGVWAADADTAHLLGTSFDGGLARIYRTDDGGATWTLRWERAGDGVFFDALRCWDVDHCVAFSDPVDGAFLIVRTTDGRTWTEVDAAHVPAPLAGEAGFAASGTAMTTAARRHAWIGTGGGPHARVYRTSDRGATWHAADTPLPASATTGIFGIAFRDTLNGVAVGGNYEQRTARSENVIRTTDGGRTWTVAGASLPAGVRYGAAYSPAGGGGPRALLAVGPSGAGVSWDDGSTWTELDGGHWNTLAFAPDGTAWIGGPEGRIARVLLRGP